MNQPIVAQEPTSNIKLVILSGMSGSGKSVALHALEDAGYYCVDNLPPELLLPFIEVEKKQEAVRIAIAMDARSANSLQLVPVQINALRHDGIDVTPLFLDAADDILLRRFSETRRKHPLTRTSTLDPTHDLQDAIRLERQLLATYREESYVIDTTLLRASQLRSHIKSLLSVPDSQLTVVFESFAFKRGVPSDADYVFDVRMLPNPHYEPEMRDLTGMDAPVIQYLEEQPSVQEMYDDIRRFLLRWLPAMGKDHRSYVTIAIGCTGGQHRSVYLAEKLHQEFSGRWSCIKRHREQEKS